MSEKEVDVDFINEHGDSIMSAWQLSEALRRMARKTKEREIKNTFSFMETLLIKSLYETLQREGSSKKVKDFSTNGFFEDVRQVFGSRDVKGSGIINHLSKTEWTKLFPNSLGFLFANYTNIKFKCMASFCGEDHTLNALNVYYDFSSPSMFFVGYHHLPAGKDFVTPYEFLQATMRDAILFRTDEGIDKLYGYDMSRSPRDRIESLVGAKSLKAKVKKHVKQK